MHIKKFTQKDRYGNQMSYEFEVPEKGLDPTKIMEKAMETMGEVPQMMSVSAAPPVGGEEFNMGDMVTHPGGPKGSDTVPAWLTPGEFVVNAEAMAVPELAQQVEDINNMGRQMKNMGGPIYQQTGGMVDEVPFLAGPRLNDPQYAEEGDWITDELLDRLAEVESGGRNDAVSPAGAVGKYQWLPDSAAKAGYGVEAFDPMDEKAAREATRQYIKNMQQHHGFTKDEALRAYNWGPKNVLDHRSGKRKDIPDEAFHYPRKILDTLPGGPAPAPRPARTNEELWSAAASDAPQGGILQTLGSLFKAEGGEIPYLFDGGQLLQSIAQDPEASAAVAPWLQQVAADPTSYINPVDTTPPAVGEDADYTNIDAPPPTEEPEVEDHPLKALRDEMFAGASGFNIPNYGGSTAYPDRSDAGVQGVVDTLEDRQAMAQEEIVTAENEAEIARANGTSEDVAAAERNVEAAEEQAALAERDVERRDAHFEVKEAEKQARELGNARDSMNRKADALEAAGQAEAAAELRKQAQQLGEDAETAGAQAEAAQANEKAIWAKEEAEGSVPSTKPAGQNPSSNSDTNIDTTTKEGNEEINKILQNADSEQRKQVQQEAESVFKDLGLDSLFDKKELARMAVMYGASRLLGYDHGGSLRWAGQQYVQRVDAKEQGFQTLALSGKYTPQSLKNFKKSGDYGDLQPVGTSPQITGEFKTFYGPGGKQVRAEKIKVGKNTYWSADGGKTRVDNSYSDDAANIPGTPEYGKRIKDDTAQYTGMVKDLRSQFGTFKGKDGQDLYATELTPGIAGNKIAKWSLDNKVPPEYMGQIIENAYHSAVEHSNRTGEKVRDLTPFLEEQYVVAQVNDASLFKGISGTNVNKLFGSVQNAARFKGKELNTTQILQGYRGIWNDLHNLPEAEFKAKYPKIQYKKPSFYEDAATDEENGFMKFIEADVANSMSE